MNPTATTSGAPAATPLRFYWRRLLQFKLRTLLFVVIPICSAFFAWWSYTAHEQRKAVAALRKEHGLTAVIQYDFEYLSQPLRSPAWLVNTLGVDYFASVFFVHLAGKPTEATFEHVKELSSLRILDVCDITISDADLAQLKRSLPNCEIRHNHRRP